MILAIDPGTQNVGFAIGRLSKNGLSIVACGVLTAKDENYLKRSLSLSNQLSAIINEQHGAISELAIEMPHANPKNIQSSLKVALVTGILIKTAQASHIDKICTYPPSEWKKGTTGNGAASKEQVKSYIQGRYPLIKGRQDAFDVACILEYHYKLVWSSLFPPQLSTEHYFKE